MTKIDELFGVLRELLSANRQLNEDSLMEAGDETGMWSDDDPIANPYAGTDHPSPADEYAESDQDLVDGDDDRISILTSKAINIAPKSLISDVSNLDDENSISDLIKQVAKIGIKDNKHPFPSAQNFYHNSYEYITDVLNTLFIHLPNVKKSNFSSDNDLAKAMINLIKFAIKSAKQTSAGNDYSRKIILHIKSMLSNPCLKRLAKNKSNLYDNEDRYQCFKMIDWIREN